MSLNTDNQRASKRQRTSRSTTSTHFDSIPFHEDEEYHQIYHREGRSRIAGEHATTSRTVTTVASNNELWAAKVSWTPQDDPNYALDEDGAGYDDAVEAEVMECEEVVKKKYPRSRVSVSPIHDSLSFRSPDTVLRIETPTRRLEGPTSLVLS